MISDHDEEITFLDANKDCFKEQLGRGYTREEITLIMFKTAHTHDLLKNFSTKELHCNSDYSLTCRNKKVCKTPKSLRPPLSRKKNKKPKQNRMRKLVEDKAG